MRVLDSVVGSDIAHADIFYHTLKNQKSWFKKLAHHANVSPENVYKSFTASLQYRLTFPNVNPFLMQCEKAINDELIPILRKEFYLELKYRELSRYH